MDNHDIVIDTLNKNARYIRGRLSPLLRQMKYMPDVRFRDDTSFDNYKKIDDLLRSPEVARDLSADDQQEEE
jgi:ribosome-binding factor A